MIILLLGVVLGGRKSLWGAFVGASVIVLLPNLLSNRHLFRSSPASASPWPWQRVCGGW